MNKRQTYLQNKQLKKTEKLLNKENTHDIG